ncbi:Cytochrome P450 monooxygenase 75 [Psilocybe cubensis]|uniref:Cytochrome P450 monooxygenase pc-3 n=2 Tax=Psilocybe cubensis TaxID=181762 RepID=A0A8H7Y206_PSICU|nr:Cytochrome P450 monooxygenase 75 [Psilocybe cubensis]KAH9483141.1 Cytochrome P450 monooxygenase 75 [Psilocybe cubensis]
MPLPPGPAYLLQNLPSLLFPPASAILAAKLLTHHGVAVPTWALLLSCVLAFPTAVFLRVLYRDVRDRRAAARHGAVLPPAVYDRWPGGVTLLAKTLDNFRNGYPGDMFVEWSEKYGHTWNLRVLFENRFFTTEPEYIKAILATQFENFEKGPLFNDQMRSVLGTGVFNSDGEMWKFHRAMTRPFFSKDRITHFDIFDRHASDALSQLRTRLRQGAPVDIQDLASRFTMDAATEFLFGNDVRSLDAGLPYPFYCYESESGSHSMADASLVSAARASLPHQQAHPATLFSKAFDEAQRLIALRSRRGVNWPLAEFWRDEVSVQMEVVNGFVEPILRAAVERKRAAVAAGDEKGVGENGEKVALTADREVKDGESLLDHLINYTEDETVLRDEILNILLAGRDTTTNSITYAVYMLAEHPTVLHRLRAEILDKVGPTRRPTFEQVKEMRYLRAVINETLRLYPAVPFNIRSTAHPVILPGKYGNKPFYLPAGSKVPYSVLLMHRRKDLWGPDADVFDPDRFLDERLKKYVTPNPFIFLPFNAGPRICLGQQFAYHETSFFLIRLLQQFSNITHAYDAQPPASRPPADWLAGSEGPKGRDRIRMKSYMTMSVLGGCWVRMEEARGWEGGEGEGEDVV